MATIEEAVALGIDEAEARVLEKYGQLDSAVKAKKKSIDHLALFKSTYAELLESVSTGVATLKQHIAEYTAANPKAKLAFDPEQLVKSSKRASKNNGERRTRAVNFDLKALALRYPGRKIYFDGHEAVLNEDGTVKAGKESFGTPSKWIWSIKQTPGIAYNVVQIDTGKGAKKSLLNAYNAAEKADEAQLPS